ncbi:zinc finger, C2H2 type [Ostertagia ostertagi]
MCDFCPDFQGSSGKHLYRHLFYKHGYRQEDIEKVKKAKREMRILSKASTVYKCKECDISYSSKRALTCHIHDKHYIAEFHEGLLICPICLEDVKSQEELLEHAQLAHETEYRLDSQLFTDKSKYEVCRQ